MDTRLRLHRYVVEIEDGALAPRAYRSRPVRGLAAAFPPPTTELQEPAQP
ncbi:DUF6545 domain-containing protein [Nocardiopsis sp. NPDC049922]